MGSKLHWLVAAGLVMLIGGAFVYFYVIVPRGELGQKAAFAELQGIEEQHRHDTSTEQPVLLEHADGTDYTILGIPTADKDRPRAWLILNDNSKVLKIVPKNERLLIRCAYIADLNHRDLVSANPLAFLQGICG